MFSDIKHALSPLYDLLVNFLAIWRTVINPLKSSQQTQNLSATFLQPVKNLRTIRYFL